MEVNRKEALRYLGYGQSLPSKSVLDMLEWAISEIVGCAKFGNTYQLFDCCIQNATISLANLQIESHGLSKHLSGCKQAILFAATLGPLPDRLLNRFSHIDMSRAVILQAAGAAIIEAYANQCQQEIEDKLQEQGLFVRPRFSPGYGDFSLQHQPEILAVLDCGRKIGLTVTESLILAPAKSITAVMGVTANRENCHKWGCSECQKTNCAYKRSDAD